MPTSRHLGALPDLKRREQVAKLRAEGLSLRQIGERVGVSKQAVASLLKYAGLGTGPRRMVNLCGRCRNPVGPAVGSIGRFKHEEELTCVACVAKDRRAPFRVRLRAARLAAGLTVAELAKRIGMEMSTLLYWELQGKRPRESLVRRLADALGLDPRLLLDGEVH
jgi:transcriptional regulator with XRE-family HTH domain